MMNVYLKIMLPIILMITFLACGGSKDELSIDQETPESLLQKSEIAYQNSQYEQSIKIAQLMLDHFPTSDLHIDAQLLIAKTLGAQEKYENQFDLLHRVLKENIIPEIKISLIGKNIIPVYSHKLGHKLIAVLELPDKII